MKHTDLLRVANCVAGVTFEHVIESWFGNHEVGGCHQVSVHVDLREAHLFSDQQLCIDSNISAYVRVLCLFSAALRRPGGFRTIRGRGGRKACHTRL